MNIINNVRCRSGVHNARRRKWPCGPYVKIKLFDINFFLKLAAVLISNMGQIRVLLEVFSSEIVMVD
jgi:hypothetical protein